MNTTEDLFGDISEDNMLEVDETGEVISNSDSSDRSEEDSSEGKEEKQEKEDPNAIEIDDEGNIIGDSPEEEEEDSHSDDLEDSKKENKSKEKGSEDSEGSKDTSASPDGGGDSSDLYKVFASDLHQKGVFDEDVLKHIEESDNVEEALYEAMELQIEKDKNSWVESLPPKVKSILNNYKEGVGLDDILSIEKNIDNLDSIEESSLESDEAVQEKIMAQFYREKGFSEDRIKKQIERAKDLDELSEDAKEAYESLKQGYESKKTALAEEAKKQEQDRKRHREEQLAALDKKIKETKEIIPGVSISSKIKQEIKEYMTKPVALTEDNKPISYVQKKRMDNPMDFDTKLNYYIRLGLFDEKPKVDALKNVAESKASLSLKEKLEQNRNRLAGKSASRKNAADGEEADSSKDMLDALNNF